MNILTHKKYLRSVIFGIEDSLVSTTGLVAGISIGSEENKSIVLLAGLVAIAIEATSMGAGEYLSDETIDEVDKNERQSGSSLVSGVLMFASYLLAGFIPLSAIIFLVFPTALYISVLLALLSLFILGFLKGKILKTPPFKSGLKIFFIGGLATMLGLIVGILFRV